MKFEFGVKKTGPYPLHCAGQTKGQSKIQTAPGSAHQCRLPCLFRLTLRFRIMRLYRDEVRFIFFYGWTKHMPWSLTSRASTTASHVFYVYRQLVWLKYDNRKQTITDHFRQSLKISFAGTSFPVTFVIIISALNRTCNVHLDPLNGATEPIEWGLLAHLSSLFPTFRVSARVRMRAGHGQDRS